MKTRGRRIVWAILWIGITLGGCLEDGDHGEGIQIRKEGITCDTIVVLNPKTGREERKIIKMNDAKYVERPVQESLKK